MIDPPNLEICEHNGLDIAQHRLSTQIIKVRSHKIGRADAEVNEGNRFFQKYFGFFKKGHL
jgi:hypothetical protein